MKIGIDVSQVIYQTGVSTYTRNLIVSLLRLRTDNDYLLFGGSLRRLPELRQGFNNLENIRTKFLPIPPSVFDLFGNRLHFPNIESIVGELDVYHSSDWSQFPSKAFKVTTIHDLAPIFLSKITNKKIVDVHKRRIRWVLSDVHRIIVPSNATKIDLIKLGANKERVVVIPEAPDHIYLPKTQEEIEFVKKKYKIMGRYLLAVGVNERKNTKRTIDAFTKAKNKDLKLLVVGHQYKKFHETRGVTFTGHVPTEDLPSLYSGAEGLLYPSLYEGFGLPILEAMACGCPVLTSNLSSMPEVAGGATVLVDPYDTSDISEGIKKLLRGRTGLTKKGFLQVKKFSWEKTAKMTLEVYNQALGRTK